MRSITRGSVKSIRKRSRVGSWVDMVVQAFVKKDVDREEGKDEEDNTNNSVPARVIVRVDPVLQVGVGLG